jgi:hypothetical protein
MVYTVLRQKMKTDSKVKNNEIHSAHIPVFLYISVPHPVWSQSIHIITVIIKYTSSSPSSIPPCQELVDQVDHCPTPTCHIDSHARQGF